MFNGLAELNNIVKHTKQGEYRSAASHILDLFGACVTDCDSSHLFQLADDMYNMQPDRIRRIAPNLPVVSDVPDNYADNDAFPYIYKKKII